MTQRRGGNADPLAANPYVSDPLRDRYYESMQRVAALEAKTNALLHKGEDDVQRYERRRRRLACDGCGVLGCCGRVLCCCCPGTGWCCACTRCGLDLCGRLCELIIWCCIGGIVLTLVYLKYYH
jgi:hypothetical protein